LSAGASVTVVWNGNVQMQWSPSGGMMSMPSAAIICVEQPALMPQNVRSPLSSTKS